MHEAMTNAYKILFGKYKGADDFLRPRRRW